MVKFNSGLHLSTLFSAEQHFVSSTYTCNLMLTNRYLRLAHCVPHTNCISNTRLGWRGHQCQCCFLEFLHKMQSQVMKKVCPGVSPKIWRFKWRIFSSCFWVEKGKREVQFQALARERRQFEWVHHCNIAPLYLPKTVWMGGNSQRTGDTIDPVPDASGDRFTFSTMICTEIHLVSFVDHCC